MCFDILSFLAFLVLFASSQLSAFSSCPASSFEDKPTSAQSLKEGGAAFKDKLPYSSSCQTQYLKDIQTLKENSLQKTDEILKDKDFQDFVAIAESRAPEEGMSSSFKENSFHRNLSDPNFPTEASCHIFVSFSLGEKALLNLASEAKKWGATLVLRGFKDGSYTKTAKALQKIVLRTGQDILIDPELFTLFSVTAVPTIVLSNPVPFLAAERIQTPLYDRLQGHVSVHYALESFAKEGDLRAEAQALLKRRDVQ